MLQSTGSQRAGCNQVTEQLQAYSMKDCLGGRRSCEIHPFTATATATAKLLQSCPTLPLSMGFSRQEYWSGLPLPSPGDLPNPGIEPRSPALQADSLPTELQGKPTKKIN